MCHEGSRLILGGEDICHEGSHKNVTRGHTKMSRGVHENVSRGYINSCHEGRKKQKNTRVNCPKEEVRI